MILRLKICERARREVRDWVVQTNGRMITQYLRLMRPNYFCEKQCPFKYQVSADRVANSCPWVPNRTFHKTWKSADLRFWDMKIRFFDGFFFVYKVDKRQVVYPASKNDRSKTNWKLSCLLMKHWARSGKRDLIGKSWRHPPPSADYVSICR